MVEHLKNDEDFNEVSNYTKQGGINYFNFTYCNDGENIFYLVFLENALNYFIYFFNEFFIFSLFFIFSTSLLVKVIINKFQKKINTQLNEEKEEESLKDDTDLKMIFIFRVDCKLKNSFIAEQTILLSKDIYKKCVLSGTENQKKMLENWSCFGCKKVTLRLKGESEEKSIEEIRELKKTFDNLGILNIMNLENSVMVVGPDVSKKIDLVSSYLKLMN